MNHRGQLTMQNGKINRRWLLSQTIQPLLFLVCGMVLLVGLGLAQKGGFLSSASGNRQVANEADTPTRYICPMMCTPPQSEPGRCPVCAMELVPAAASSGGSNERSIHIDPASRRIANIQIAMVRSVAMKSVVHAVGEISYDEGARKTLSAYVDGRLDRLYADYTGLVVNKGDQLAQVYSPRLYTSQVGLLLAKKAMNERNGSRRGYDSNRELYDSTYQRLIELGMTTEQIARLEESGEANSRLYLYAPMNGTIIEKLAVEGQYVKEGEPIYKLADLSHVWLMLKLFPRDAAAVRYGQKIEAEVQSLPGKSFAGRVAFIDPNVDPKTRTVGVRVVIPNAEGLLRIGDYAKASIEIPFGGRGQKSDVYDPTLADKWISPRHPHVIEDAPGKCRVCGVDLVPASNYGFTANDQSTSDVLTVPRDAVLMAGNKSVVYVESEPGHFEIRQVVVGESSNSRVAILEGLEEGEQVATRGNFLIDSQMQLAGNPSLIDPTKAVSQPESESSAEIVAALASLSDDDRLLAEQQGVCLVADAPLGSMGTPIKIVVNDRPIFACCEGCRSAIQNDPEKYFAKLDARKANQSFDAEQSDLPPIFEPEPIEEEGDFPPIEMPIEIVPVDEDVSHESNTHSDEGTR